MSNQTFRILVALIVVGLLAFFIIRPPENVEETQPVVEQTETAITQPTPSTQQSVSVATLSSDKKDILINGVPTLRIDDEKIIEFFRSPKSFMCNPSNIGNTPTRRAFCTDRAAFRASTYFTKIVPSPSGNVVGFVIGSDELEPDTLSGIFFPKNTTYRVHIITTYYLGNDFLAFSPSGTRFVYRERCFEARCGFTIKETNTLKTLRALGDPEKEPGYQFIRWISDSIIEYRIGDDDIKQLAI